MDVNWVQVGIAAVIGAMCAAPLAVVLMAALQAGRRSDDEARDWKPSAAFVNIDRLNEVLVERDCWKSGAHIANDLLGHSISQRDYARATCTLLAHQRDRLLRLLHTACAERDADIEAGRRWSRLYQEERDKRVALAKQARAWKVLVWAFKIWLCIYSADPEPNIPDSLQATIQAHVDHNNARRVKRIEARRAKRQGVG